MDDIVRESADRKKGYYIQRRNNKKNINNNIWGSKLQKELL